MNQAPETEPPLSLPAEKSLVSLLTHMNKQQLFQFAKFLCVGVLNTLVGLSVIYAAKWFLGMGDLAANALGYTVGLTVSFTLNSRWTFNHSGPQWPALFKFLLVSLVAYGMNLLTVMISIHYFGLNDYLAQALGTPPYTLTSFFASKYLVFRAQSPRK